jgi:putative phosphoesterase
MRVVIISDIHDNLENLRKCLNYCKKNKIEAIFCCGDVTTKETLSFLGDNFIKKIHLVHGNCTLYSESDAKKYSNIIDYGRIARFKIDNYNIGLCHEPWLKEKVLELGDCDYIFYGHTHRPWEDDFGEYKFINPGAIGGGNPPFTFAVWDSKANDFQMIFVEKL